MNDLIIAIARLDTAFKNLNLGSPVLTITPYSMQRLNSMMISVCYQPAVTDGVTRMCGIEIRDVDYKDLYHQALELLDVANEQIRNHKNGM
jgi:hypothetical protein